MLKITQIDLNLKKLQFAEEYHSFIPLMVFSFSTLSVPTFAREWEGEGVRCKAAEGSLSLPLAK